MRVLAERGVLVLGAGGFIGRALVARLAARGEPVIAAVRNDARFGSSVAVRATGELSAATDWSSLLANVRAVVHLASRAHAPPGDAQWIEREADAAAALGAAARRAGTECILVMSSVKVYGPARGAQPFGAGDPPAPADAYGRAKLRLESAIAASGAPVVVLRPPLVYGPGVKANFLTLMRLVMRGVPLPFANITNQRSFIFLDNLLDLVEVALTAPEASGQTLLLRDDRDLSTPELVRLIASGLGRSARLLPCKPGMLRALLRLSGRGEDAERLLQSLAVDDRLTRARLGWQPRVAIEAGIAETCRWFIGGGA